MRDLTSGSILRHLLLMTLFLMASMLVQSLYFLADLYWVGRLGREAIAAVGLAANVLLMVLASTQALGVGTTALVARAVGQRDRHRANLFFNQTLSLSIFCAAACLVIGELFYSPYVRWLAADASTQEAGRLYLRWFVPALALQYPLIVTGAALRGSGIVRPTMVILAISVVLNLVLAPILIFGWGTGWPLGISGAAIATLIAVMSGGMMLGAYVARGQRYLRVEVSRWNPAPAIWREVIAIGLPAGAELGVLAVYLFLVYVLLRPFGAAAQGGFAVGARIGQSLILPAVALAMAAAPLVGQNYGAGDPGRIRRTFSTAVIVAVVLMTGMMLIVRSFATPMVALFTRDDLVAAVAVGYLRILALTFVATALIFAAVGIFQGLGRTILPFVSSVVRLAVFLVPAFTLFRGSASSLTVLWAISAVSIAIQAALNVFFVTVELRTVDSSLAVARSGRSTEHEQISSGSGRKTAPHVHKHT